MSPVILERTIAKLERHADIVEEFKLWIETKEYKTDTPLQIEGYTAEDILRWLHSWMGLAYLIS